MNKYQAAIQRLRYNTMDLVYLPLVYATIRQNHKIFIKIDQVFIKEKAQ